MKKTFSLIAILLFLASCGHSPEGSVRKERKAILEGNSFYQKAQYKQAIKAYSKALEENPASPEAAFNLGLAQFSYATILQSKGDSLATQYAEAGESTLSVVASARGRAVPLAAMACYNLANRKFREDKFDDAIGLYEQSLRLAPGVDYAIRNLRIAQLKKEEQDQNKDQNKDQNQDQNKDQQNKDQQNKDQQDKDQNKDNQKDQNKEQDKQNEPEQRMNSQTMSQILNAMENKETSTRARLNRQGKQKQNNASQTKRW